MKQHEFDRATEDMQLDDHIESAARNHLVNGLSFMVARRNATIDRDIFRRVCNKIKDEDARIRTTK